MRTEFAIVAVHGFSNTSLAVCGSRGKRMKISTTSGTELEMKLIEEITGGREGLKTSRSTVKHARIPGTPTSTTSCSTCKPVLFTSSLYNYSRFTSPLPTKDCMLWLLGLTSHSCSYSVSFVYFQLTAIPFTSSLAQAAQESGTAIDRSSMAFIPSSCLRDCAFVAHQIIPKCTPRHHTSRKIVTKQVLSQGSAPHPLPFDIHEACE